jgi:hypothetical protein
MHRENRPLITLRDFHVAARRALLPLIVFAGLLPVSVFAQSTASQAPELPAAEQYVVEGSFGYWRPAANIALSSDALGVPGTHIDLRNELGLRDEAFAELQLTWHPKLRHRFRFQYIPIQFDSTAAVPRDLVFNGVTYRTGTLVSSSLAWTTYRVGYEYDFMVKPRSRLGLVAEVKHTRVRAELRSSDADEVSRQSMPVPALGINGRFYPARRLSLDAEMTFFGVPDRADGHFGGRIADLDLSAVWNFTRSLGVQGGFRDLDIHHLGEWNTAEFSLKGGYVAAVFRY